MRRFVVLLLSATVVLGHELPVYLDPDCPVAERVEDLIGHLSLPEKIGLFETENPPIPRLGVPTRSWWNEGVHGVARAGRATMFPAAIGLAATWDVELLTRVATVISDEARAKHNLAPTNRYHGLTYWAPCVDLARDPRWGRIEETYGEDPHLTARLGVAYVKAMQGDDPRYLKLVATPKHFAAHAQETARHSTAPTIAPRTLREYYLEPFRACFVEGGARSVMTAYSGINGVPCMINQWLLTDLLRGEWGFQGAVVTDWNAPNTIKNNFKLTANHAETVALGLVAGIDIFCQPGGIHTALTEAVTSGLVPASVLDAALRRSLRLRFELGEFDPLDRVWHRQIPPDVIGCSNHVALAREASQKAIVLLKNAPVAGRNSPTPLLPLDREKLESIAVIGSHANRIFLGAYSGDPAQPAVTTLQGVTNHVSDRVIVRHVPHIDLDERRRRLKKNETLDPKTIDEEKQNLAAALDAAARSDVAVVVLGLSSRIEAEGRDRTDLNLPKDQQEFVEKVFAVNPATIVVLINGSPLAVNWLHQHVPAILEAWYPGEQGGTAIADVLFGDYNPAGRLPITFYAGLEQLPNLFDYEISLGRTYMYLPTPPLYPFGHGLSYTCFDYQNLRVTQTPTTITVTVDITNSGGRAGDEVAQLYVRELDAPWPVPLKQLRGFQRVHIPVGATRPVTFTLKVADLARWDETRHAFVVRPGIFELMVGASSADIRILAPLRID
ncbi:MAG: Thermostable beta-glucosidase B [Verrucomicrobiae bacterium]|nr:Thermostable beta-glucosidase B [Verrucomicrobiae bacterium]